MGDADVVKPPVDTEEASPDDGELPSPEKEDEGLEVDASDPYAYWKSLPGLWKLLQFMCGSISLICVIICFVPVWTVKSGTECPIEWQTGSYLDKDGNKIGTKILKAEDIDITLSIEKDNESTGNRLIDKYWPQLRGHIYEQKWTQDGNDTKGSRIGSQSQAGQLSSSGGNQAGIGSQSSLSHFFGSSKYCYGSLTYPDGKFGKGRHDLWLYSWVIVLFCAYVVNILVIVFQLRNSAFVNKFKKPLLIYYIIISGVIDVPSLAMLGHVTTHINRYDINLPRSVPCIVGAIYTTLFAAFHCFSFVWSLTHQAP